MGDNIPVRTTTSSFLDYFPPISSNNNNNEVINGLFDYDQRSSCSSLGFMDLLNTQAADFGHSLFDVISPSLQQTSSIHESQPSKSQLIQESSSRVQLINCNTPATPNSSSISNSESIGGHENEELAKEVVVEGDQENKLEDEVDDDEEEERQHTKKHLKSKKIIEKKQREPRFAFMTRSEVDHLEDGYRWRKYGQKAVKNSSFPRSYFRCTTASCNVKKRVERSFNDPSIVVTTYEGKHTHPSTAAAPPPYSALSCGGAAPFPPELMLLSAAQQTHLNHSIPLSCGYMDSTNIMSFTVPAWLTDHGLVEEMVKRNELKY